MDEKIEDIQDKNLYIRKLLDNIDNLKATVDLYSIFIEEKMLCAVGK